ncbi:putative bifunctional diguanylate cyclase/phosphodiesterase [Aliiroseovarius crassostreae]|uniref:putative bifunctional diguanylate cyclase/phosphodiesterase n=1 Tax=Aliiroseovarius crassostreae TaxID=154981 RepID=UPI003C7CA891
MPWARFGPTLYVFLATLLVCIYADYQHRRIELQEERDRVRRQVETLGAQLEGSINAPLQMTRGLVATLATEPDMSQRRFSWLADRVLGSMSGIRNIAAANDLVVTLVHPMDGNEATLGLDYARLEQQREAAFHVRDTGEFILTGPVDLVQGGQGIIGRFPVFTTQEDARTFWGILSVVIDLPTLYQNAGLTAAADTLDLALVGNVGINNTGIPFLGSASILAGNPEAASVVVPNGSWELFALPKNGWGSTLQQIEFRLFLVLSALAVVGLAAMANHMSVQRQLTIQRLERREDQLETARRELEALALHDHLTGLPNRRFLDRKLSRLMGKAFPGVIQLDLDGFKSVNDLQGHAVGDLLLVQVAERLQTAAGPDTFLARSGGDEFVVICLPSSGPETASTHDGQRLQETAQRLIDSLKKPFLPAGRKCHVGVTAGIHRYRPKDGLSAEEVLAQADRAMYDAKQAGRNRFQFSTRFRPGTDGPQHSADELIDALQSGQIVPYYQPQFSNDGVEIVGVEALARWDHPQKGVLLPREFMPLAHALKVENDVDHCILKQAARDLAQWDEAGIAPPQISVNVSFRRLNDPRLINQVDKLRLPAKRVALELLESIFVDDRNPQVLRNISALKSRGFRIELDDFGTGHSSVSGLLQLVPHCFKIDRSLVQAAPRQRKNRRLLATIAEIGHALNIEVCAEGVETQEQLITARDVGCTILQGFYLAKPMSEVDLRVFLQKSAQQDRSDVLPIRAIG